MPRLEPYVKASEIVRRVPNLLDINGSSNIGLVMVSAIGPRLAYIQGPAQFLATYTLNGDIPRNADITFVNAYYLSFSAGLVIARSMNTTANSGLLFVENQENPIPVIYKDGVLLTKETTLLFPSYDINNSTGFAFALNDVVFYKNDFVNVSQLPAQIYSTAVVITNNNPKYVLQYLNGVWNELGLFQANVASDNDLSNANLEGVYEAVASWDSIVSNFQVNSGDLLQFQNGVWTNLGPAVSTSITSEQELYALTIDEYIVDGAPYKWNNSQQVWQKQLTYANYQIFVEVDNLFDVAGTISTWRESTAVFNPGSPINSIGNISNRDQLTSNNLVGVYLVTNNFDLVTHDVVDDNDLSQISVLGFYKAIASWNSSTGAGPITSGDIIYFIDNPSTWINLGQITTMMSVGDLLEFNGNLWSRLATPLPNIKVDHGIFVEFITNPNLNIGINILDPITLFSPSIANYVDSDGNLTDVLFAVIANAAQSSNIYKAMVSNIDEYNFDLSLTYPGPEGDVTDTYQSSLNTNAVDLNGASVFIDNLNTIPGFGFSIDIFQTDMNLFPVSMTNPFPFGNSGLSLEESKKPSNLRLAVNELEDQEIYDIEYLAPVGITNLSFLKRFTQAGRVNYWFTPVDVPRDRTNANSIQMYMREIDDSNNVMAVGPFDKNSGLTGWINFIAFSTLYYEKLMNNKANGAEFAPIFDREFGTVQMVSPTFQLGKIDREKLLSFGAPVNFVKYDQRLDLFYLNNNLTHQSVDDVMSEEQNRRLVNKIKKNLIRLMAQFKGKYNTSSTREMVISLITFYFQNNIMNQQFPPDAYQIICDESNNPDELIRANKLAVTVKIRLYNSIKYIDILHEIFPIGVDFNQFSPA